MADSGGRRMLFDTSSPGRKRVLRVVYAILALLMGASLFLTVGPFNLSEIFSDTASSSASDVFEEKAERVEERLAENPKDEALLLNLTRTRIGAAGAHSEENPETGGRLYPVEGLEELEAAQVAWSRYLKVAGDEPNPAAAQLVASTNFGRAEAGGTLEEIEQSLIRAAAAQQLATEARPSIGSLSSLAIYEYFAGDFAAGDKAAKQAAQKATSKSEAKGIEKQIADYRERAKAWDKQRQEVAKEAQKQGKEQLQNPLGGLSGGGISP